MKQLRVINYELRTEDSLSIKPNFQTVCALAVFLILFAPTALCESPYELKKSFYGDGVGLRIRLDKKEASIADTIKMQVEAIGLDKYEFDLPEVSEELGTFEVIDSEIAPERIDSKERVIKSAVYRLEPMETGEVEIPSLEMEYVRQGHKNTKTLESSPIKLNIKSVLKEQAETAEAADIEGVIEVHDYLPYIIAGGMGLMFAVLMAFVIAKKSSQKEQAALKVFKTAHEIALQRLKELEEQGLASSGKLKIFYEKVSNVLRYYIEDRFKLKAPERTTEEFLAELKFDYTLAAEDKEALEQFLRHCDLVKFAKHEPDDQQVQRTLNLVRDFVERTKSEECKIEVK